MSVLFESIFVNFFKRECKSTMSDVQEERGEASSTSFEEEPAKEDDDAKRDPDSSIDGDDNSASGIFAEFGNENSESDVVSGSEYDSSSLYSSEKDDSSKSYKGDSKPAKPKRTYRKPRKRHRTDVNQLKRLEEVYQYDSNPNQELRAELSKESGMSVRQIQVWFQNRRAKTRRDAARMQLKARAKETDEVPSADPVAAEDPANLKSDAQPAQEKPPKEPKKRGPKGKRNAQSHSHHKHKHKHKGGGNTEEDKEREGADGEAKKRRHRRHKKARVDNDGSSQSELSCSDGGSSSYSSSESGSSSEFSSESSEDGSDGSKPEFQNPSYMYQKVLDYMKKGKKIDSQESIEQDEKRLFG